MLQGNLCPFADKCWRLSYTKYLKDHARYPSKGPPNRTAMWMQGYATQAMMQAKSAKKQYSGIYAEAFPQPGGVNYCPVERGREPRVCGEHNKEQRRIDKLKGAREQRYKDKTKRPRPSIPPSIRREVARRDRYKCVYCTRPHGAYWDGKQVRTCVDHFIPHSKGGSSDLDNLVLACFDCNSDKSDQIWERGCRIGYYGEPHRL